MRPRVLYELSRHVALMLENGLREGRRPSAAVPREEKGSPGPLGETSGSWRREEPALEIPVFLCHPLEPMEHREALEKGIVGILYPVRIAPDPRYRQAGLSLEPQGLRVQGECLRKPGLWIRVRYAFLVSGGSLEDQLGAMAAALRTLHDNPLITLGASPESSSDLEDSGEGSFLLEGGAFPLTIVEDPEGWRELGLSEHRLTISFEVTVSISSTRAEPVERVLERELRLEEEPR